MVRYVALSLLYSRALPAVSCASHENSLPNSMPPVNYWEVIADKLSAAGWSWGYCSTVTANGWRWVVDAHRGGRRYIIDSDELLSAFLELEAMLL